jgi:hypothetical protein
VFLTLLPMALSRVKEYREPTKEQTPEDTMIGNLKDEHKALYTLWLQTKKEADLKTVEANYETDPKEKEALSGKAYELAAKAQLVYEGMWIDINDEFECWAKMYLQIRKGWVLVQSPPPKQPQYPFFRFGPMPPESE